MQKETGNNLSLVSGTKWTSLSAAISVVFQISQMVVLARWLEPSQFGVMAMMLVAVAFTNAISDFGLGNFLIQRENLGRKEFLFIFAFVAFLSAIFALAIIGGSDFVAGYYRNPTIGVMLPWLSLSVVFTALSQIVTSIQLRLHRFDHIAKGEILFSATSFIVSIALCYFGFGVWALVAASVLSSATKLIFGACISHRLSEKLDNNSNFNLGDAFRFGTYQTGDRVLNFINSNVDKLILGRALGEIGLGIYSVSYQLMIRPYSILNPIFNRVALPVFVGARNNDRRLGRVYLYNLKIISLITFPIYLSMAILSPILVTMILGPKWIDAVSVLSILSVLGMFYAIGNPIGALIIAKSKPEYAFYFNICSFFSNSIAIYFGAHFSVDGVAIASLLSSGFVIFPMEFILRKKLAGITARHYLKYMRSSFYAVLIPLVAHFFLVSNFGWNRSLLGCSLEFLLLISIFIGVLYRFEKKFIVSLVLLSKQGS